MGSKDERCFVIFQYEYSKLVHNSPYTYGYTELILPIII